MTRTGTHRGLTLLEVLVAAALLSVVISVSLSSLIGANQASERIRRVGDVQENARLALDILASDIRNAGMGAQLGLVGVVGTSGVVRRLPVIYAGANVVITDTNVAGGTTTISTNSIYIISGQPTTGTLSANGAGMLGSVVSASQGAPLTVTCYAPTDPTAPKPVPVDCSDVSAKTNFGEYTVVMPNTGGFEPLLVGDYRNAVYLRPTALSAPVAGVPPADSTQSLAYTEQTSSSFSVDPRAPFGFAPGAVLQRARVVHYYIAPSKDGTFYELRRSKPVLASSAGDGTCGATDNPFEDETTKVGGVPGAVMGSGPIESLQIRYIADPSASDTENQYQLVNMGVCDQANVPALREIRVEVVARSQVPDKDTNGALRNQYSTPGFEGATPATPNYLDAYPRRSFSVSVVPRNLQGVRL